MGGALEGLRVLDLTWGTAGPMTTMFLADNGADVIRIEPPSGDPFAGQTGYRVWNRGKRSAVLDLQADEGRREFLALAAQSDVVIDSFSPGTTKRLGIDHEVLDRVNPRLITCSITGYGEHPAHRDRPGYDALVAATDRACCSTRKDGAGPRWSSSAGVPGPSPSSTPPRAWCAAPTATGPSFREPSGRASVRPTSPRSASRLPCTPARSVAKDSG